MRAGENFLPLPRERAPWPRLPPLPSRAAAKRRCWRRNKPTHSRRQYRGLNPFSPVTG